MNLIICCTGLQVLIAEKILLEYPKEKFCLLMFKTLDNKKNDYYFNRLATNPQITSSKMIVLDAQKSSFSLLNMFNNFVYIKKNIDDLKSNFSQLDKIFFSYITDLYIHFILKLLSFSEIYTFDDGTANIISSSFLYDKSISWKKKVLYYILGLPYNQLSLKTKIKLHYTIYPNFPNIIDDIKNVRLLRNMCIKELELAEPVKVMIGQFVFGDERDIILTQQLINKFKIDYYFPSPRESHVYSSVVYVNTHLIFEDYFIQNLANKKCIVYTFFSSGALNISEFPNVEIICLKPKGLNNNVWEQIYQFFEKIGIKVEHCEL